MSLDNLEKRTDPPGPSAPADDTQATPDQDRPPAASVYAFIGCIMYISYLNTTTNNVLDVRYIEERRFKQEYSYANN